MKKIKYKFLSCEVNHGTEENPDIEQILLEKSMGWNPQNEEIARREAYNGEYEIFDDGQPDPPESEIGGSTESATYDELARVYEEGVNSLE